MAGYVIRRFLSLIPLLFILSIIVFIIIELPPGDFLTVYIEQLKSSGVLISEEEVARLVKQYALDKPLHIRYVTWIKNIILHGDFGRSFRWNRPVVELIKERVALSVVISLFSIVFVWIIGVSIGIYSAVKQYSIFDYIFTFIGFIGVSIPGFLLALLVIWFAYTKFDIYISGLFSQQFVDAPWSLAKILDMLKHIWVPVVIIAVSGIAGNIRTMRANLLDELRKQYVTVARAKGLSETRLLIKYPIRIAVNPMISTIGWTLPAIFSGESLASIILNLPTIGPLLMQALLAQDMYLAGSLILIMGALTLVGTLISDILLAWADPRIRYGNTGGK
ncbi:peptide/nickel transport system permease protein [Caldicoprobacter guelmensis]|uniref:ABC transporter permease n=1 Tax=Caldicoprobacter guelmensis TaxID=1170224 RepID=UPI00195DF662|nr:ABC transporter permease [Caldicoprobacter guelmensis]MBM7582481.1 peptide/nickel transport system permease protein [Caldicoprobacter guelmensis]